MILDVAVSAKLPISIHSRNSFEDVYNILSKKNGIRGVIHCFTGDLSEAMRYIDLGFYLGIGGILTFKKSRLKDVLVKVPLNCIVLETDSPYLTPVPYRGKPNKPAYVKYVAEEIAKIREMPLEELIDITTTNAERFFGI
jgi:TatD DNase family protein